jgi:hypothetical protein
MKFNKENYLSETFPPILTFVALDLLVTVIFVTVSPSSSSIGTLRPVDTIPSKLVELVLIGLAVGLISSVAFRKIDLSMITISLAFVALLDLDHLPSALGFSEPIRPAHSIMFLAVLMIFLAFVSRKQPEVELLAVAAFLGHMAGDTGEFAVFAPFSFAYSGLDPYRVPLAIGAVVFALLAGYVKYRRYKQKSKPMEIGMTVNESQNKASN